MNRFTILLLILGVCTVNGILSPYLVIAIPITTALMPELFPKTGQWVLFLSSVAVATTTMLFSGVPAALYERLVDKDPESPVPMWIWMGGALALSLPALANLA